MWKCEKCETVNSGGFCIVCQTAMPERQAPPPKQTVSNQTPRGQAAPVGRKKRGNTPLIAALISVTGVALVAVGVIIGLVANRGEPPMPTPTEEALLAGAEVTPTPTVRVTPTPEITLGIPIPPTPIHTLEPIVTPTPTSGNDFNIDDTGYILPFSSTRTLTDADLRNLSSEELRIARNEIYARHGRQFIDQELQAWFNSKSWYANLVKLPIGTEPTLTPLEISNVTLIRTYEAG
jgi:hypothetical protein